MERGVGAPSSMRPCMPPRSCVPAAATGATAALQTPARPPAPPPPTIQAGAASPAPRSGRWGPSGSLQPAARQGKARQAQGTDPEANTLGGVGAHACKLDGRTRGIGMQHTMCSAAATPSGPCGRLPDAMVMQVPPISHDPMTLCPTSRPWTVPWRMSVQWPVPAIPLAACEHNPRHAQTMHRPGYGSDAPGRVYLRAPT